MPRLCQKLALYDKHPAKSARRSTSAALDPYALKSLLQQAWTAKCPVLFERGVIYRPMDAPKATQGVADKATVQTKSATTGDGEQNRE